jgi:hypothetical protein
LPGCLEIDRRTVCFSPSAPATVDLYQLTHWLALNELAGWVEAVAHYPAPFLHGVYVDDAPELESWLLREQERWQQAATRVLQRLIQHHTDEAAYMLALGYVQQLLALEPWREEAQRQAMLLLARTGQVSAALLQYDRCRHILQTELAVEPDPETERLYAKLKAITPAPSLTLLAATTPFMGRAAELAELPRLLANPNNRLITIACNFLVRAPGGCSRLTCCQQRILYRLWRSVNWCKGCRWPLNWRRLGCLSSHQPRLSAKWVAAWISWPAKCTTCPSVSAA